MSSEINPKKRVLFIITQAEWGGAQRFLYNLVSNLSSSKYEMMVATGSDGDNSLTEALKKKEITSHGLKFLKRDLSAWNDLRAVKELRSLIQEFKPDTLFLNSSKAGIIGSLAARKFPTLKVIYRIGGWSFNDPLPLIMRQFYIWAEKYTSKFKDFIIVNNQHDFAQAHELKIKPRKKLLLIYNGIDPYKLDFLDKNEAKIKIYGILDHKPKESLSSNIMVGTIANFYKTKGLTYLIQAAKELLTRYSTPEISFVIIGDGPERKNLETQIKDLGLENKIFLTGRIPNASNYLPAFDIFVLPSLKEGFPWAVLEAMSAKLPVIATQVGANPEIIENQKNGILVKPADPLAMASAIKHLIDNDAIRREMGIQGHQLLLLRFDMIKMVRQIEGLL